MQHIAQSAAVTAMADEYAALKEAHAKAEKRMDVLRRDMLATGRSVFRCSDGSEFHTVNQTREGLDTPAVKAHLGDALAQFLKVTEFQTLRYSPARETVAA